MSQTPGIHLQSNLPWCIPEDPKIDHDKASTEEFETGIELHKKPLNHSLIEFQSEAIFDKNSFEVIADNKNNFQTSIKGSSRTIPEDSMDNPGRGFT